MSTDHSRPQDAGSKKPGSSPTLSFHDATDPSSPTQASESGSNQVSGSGPETVLTLPCQFGRYLLEYELDRGGMGVILRGRDEQFERPLAFKVVLDKYRQQPRALHRFHNEAQITGQLQHPGVPPVHELGELPDGRPFFSMKLIEGRSLDRMLADRSGPDDELPKFIGIFEQVCQTLAYAHSQRIIHRDAKPNNVMVGAFAEVQVMDWGLAKHLDQDSVLEVLEPLDDGGGGPDQTAHLEGVTQAGSILGTPAYLAPEQARGEIDLLDERCDVFGLGAILCEILTGTTPYFGTTTQQIHTKAARADTTEAFARLDACGADAELIDLAKHCMAAEREDRPRSAQAVANAVARYQVTVRERLQAAEVAKTKAEGDRKRRRLWLALAAMLVVLLAGVAGAAFWYQQDQAEERERQLLADQEERDRKREADEKERQAQAQQRQKELEERLRRESKQKEEVAATVTATRQQIELSKWVRARFLIDRTRQKLSDAPMSITSPLDDAAKEVDLAEKLYNLRLIESHFDKGAGEKPKANESYRKLFAEEGLDLFGEEKPTELAKRIRESGLKRHWVAALDDWAQAATTKEQLERILEVARLADPHPKRNEFRQIDVIAKMDNLQARLERTKASELPPDMWAVLGLWLQLGKRKPAALAMFRKAQLEYPDDFWLNYLLANGLYGPGPREAVSFYRAALAIRPDSLGATINLSDLLYRGGNIHEATELERRGLRLHPDSATLHHNLGVALLSQNKVKEALHHAERAAELRPKSASAWVQLGHVRMKNKQLEKAIEAYEKTLEIDEFHVEARVRLALLHKELNQREKALERCREALDLAENDKMALNLLAELLHAKGDFAGSIDALKKLQPQDKANRDLYIQLVTMLRRLGRTPEAIYWLRVGTKELPKDGQLHCMLAIELRQLAQFDAALQSLETGMKHLPKGSPMLARARSDHLRIRNFIEWDKCLRLVVAGKGMGLSPQAKAGAGYIAYLYRRLYRHSAELYQQAFQAEPKLAESVDDGRRFVAARSAVLTSRREGLDAEKVTDEQRVKWREQALAWLRADLEAWQKRAKDRPVDPDRKIVLKDWLTHEALSSVRDEPYLSKLPKKEQEGWRELWTETKTLYEKTREK